MAGTFKEALGARYEAIQRNARIETKEFTVSDLVSIFGSKKELNQALADERGIKLGSAQKAISRLERYERGDRGGDVRNAAKISDTLQELARERIESKGEGSQVGGSGSGMGGGTMNINGTIGVSGYGDDYEEDRDIDWDLDEEDLDSLAEAAWELGEDAANHMFADMYGFENMYVVNADIWES